MVNFSVVFSPAQAAEHVAAGHTEVHAEAGAFPPFDAQYWPPHLFWLGVVFLCLYIMLSRFALPRVAHVLYTRRTQLARDLDEASQARAQADAAHDAYKKHLSDAQITARTLAAQMHEQSLQESQTRRQNLEQNMQAKLMQAEGEIRNMRDQAMSQVDDIAQGLAHAIVHELTDAGQGSTQPQLATATN